jgi:hypothetical protein
MKEIPQTYIIQKLSSYHISVARLLTGAYPSHVIIPLDAVIFACVFFLQSSPITDSGVIALNFSIVVCSDQYNS